jgi:UDP-GlcNAc3NAcA epimerase
MKVLTVVGARPQFVKAAVVSQALAHSGSIREVMVHTGQHYDPAMSAIFFSELELAAPDYNLHVGSGTHGVQTAHMIERLEPVLMDERPDWVVVYGDTNSTVAAALTAAKLHMRLAHIEAGLRSFDRRMPEEINRVVTDHLAGLLFAPTETAVSNLLREGIAAQNIQCVGDVMYDAAIHFAERAEKNSNILDKLGLRPSEYVLCTVHRAENTDDPSRLRAIFQALCSLARDLPVVVPLHPRTRDALQTAGIYDSISASIRLVPPVGYLDMVAIEKHAVVIATDSGGVQKEAFFYAVPCVTLRLATEWTELVQLGWNRLADPGDAYAIEAALRGAIGCRGRAGDSEFGDGSAAQRIANTLLGNNELQKGSENRLS